MEHQKDQEVWEEVPVEVEAEEEEVHADLQGELDARHLSVVDMETTLKRSEVKQSKCTG